MKMIFLNFYKINVYCTFEYTNQTPNIWEHSKQYMYIMQLKQLKLPFDQQITEYNLSKRHGREYWSQRETS